MKRNKTIYKSIIDKYGITDALVCPQCNGEGHFLEDNTHANGGTMSPYLCDCCEGKGAITEDMIANIMFDSKGEPVIIYKNHKDDDNTPQF